MSTPSPFESLEELVKALRDGSPLHGFDRSGKSDDEFFNALGVELGRLWEACTDLSREIDTLKRAH